MHTLRTLVHRPFEIMIVQHRMDKHMDRRNVQRRCGLQRDSSVDRNCLLYFQYFNIHISMAEPSSVVSVRKLLDENLIWNSCRPFRRRSWAKQQRNCFQILSLVYPCRRLHIWEAKFMKAWRLFSCFLPVSKKAARTVNLKRRKGHMLDNHRCMRQHKANTRKGRCYEATATACDALTPQRSAGGNR